MLVSSVKTLSEKHNLDEMMDMAISVCKNLQLFPDDVCEGMVHLAAVSILRLLLFWFLAVLSCESEMSHYYERFRLSAFLVVFFSFFPVFTW